MEKLEINYLPNQTGSKFSLAITGMIVAAVGGFIEFIGISLYGLGKSPSKLIYEIVGGSFSLLGNILMIVFYSYFAKACHEVDEKLEKRINRFITFFSLAIFSNLLLTFDDSKFLLLNSVGGSIIGLIYYIIIANNLKGSYSGLMEEVGRLMARVLYVTLSFFLVAIIFITILYSVMFGGFSSSSITFLYWMGGIISLAWIVWIWRITIKLFSTMNELMVNGEDEINPLLISDSQSDSETFEQKSQADGFIQPFNIEYQHNAQTTTISNPGFYTSSHHVPDNTVPVTNRIEPEQSSQTLILPVHEKEKGPNNLLFYIISGVLFLVIVGLSIHYYQSSQNQQYDSSEDISNLYNSDNPITSSDIYAEVELRDGRTITLNNDFSVKEWGGDAYWEKGENNTLVIFTGEGTSYISIIGGYVYEGYYHDGQCWVEEWVDGEEGSEEGGLEDVGYIPIPSKGEKLKNIKFFGPTKDSDGN